MLGAFLGKLRHYRNVAHQTIERIISMASVHVLEALNEGQLKSNGTLQEQKKRLVAYELRKWVESVKESYTPPGEAATTSFNAAIDSEVQSLRAYYEARAVSLPAPSSAYGAAGGLEYLSGSANDIANSLRREPVARPAGDRPFLRAGEQIFTGIQSLHPVKRGQGVIRRSLPSAILGPPGATPAGECA